jgi:hypothetical protein
VSLELLLDDVNWLVASWLASRFALHEISQKPLVFASGFFRNFSLLSTTILDIKAVVEQAQQNRCTRGSWIRKNSDVDLRAARRRWRSEVLRLLLRLQVVVV